MEDNKHDEMRKRLREADVGIFTETKLKEEDKLRMTGYRIIRKDRVFGVGRGGGVMIMVRKDIIWETIRDSDISENTDI